MINQIPSQLRRLGLVVLGILLLWHFFSLRTLPNASLARASKDGAASVYVGGRSPSSKCLTIFVAPWCPACQQAKPIINSVIEDLRARGLQVVTVVTMDKEKAIQDCASGYSGTVAADPDGKYYHQAGANGVPYFVVTDTKGKVLKAMGGCIMNREAMEKALGLNLG